ncbi:ArsR/SmtB family transcription factor [Reinekea blandensis]|uniref:Predicted transcriptional regulator n=1 Tax=Reinekea blandensis MED297 TaxID=314283 RepID=A4BFL8_9GAMM|nr:winged helix-turn-helix domain-containing protein [Reinekea blandensis]EAR09113.1 predicted transcriptional regulator [Reinekea sp. MED297] [Reinekea blandensis MED297]
MQPDIATLGSLIGDDSRAHMLTALMGGKALTATELALEADITAQTATRHLTQLVTGKLLTVRKQGRHKYFQLANHQVADVLESLLTLSTQLTIPHIKTGPSDPALRFARVCYDHLAGEIGVQLYNGLVTQGLLLDQGDVTHLTDKGRRFFSKQGFDMDAYAGSKRPLCKSCLDWSERTNHLAGSIGKWILQDLFEQKMVTRRLDSRAVTFSDRGLMRFKARYGL